MFMAITSIPGTHALAAVAVLIAAKLVWEFLYSPLKAFPGPVAAKFTDFYRAYLMKTGNPDPYYRAWHGKWGPAVRVGPNTISLSDPDMIKVVYNTKNVWRKSNMYDPNDIVADGKRITNLFNTRDEAFHSKYMKPIRGFWSLSKVLESEPYLDETLTKWTNKLAATFVDGPAAGSVCMMDKWMAYVAWDTAANFSFGYDYGFVDEARDVGDILKESRAGIKYYSAVSQIPWLDEWLDKNPIIRIGPRPLVNGFVSTVNIMARYHKEVAEGIYKPKGTGTFIDKYEALKEVYPDFVDDNQVINWLMLNVLAGGDSAAGTLRAVVYYLAKSPDSYDRLIAELDAANLPLPAQYKDFSKLIYLDAVIREAMRINPGVGFMLEREIPQSGFELPDGRFVPAGTKVGLNPVVVSRHKRTFGENADQFDPDRWLQRLGESTEQFDSRFRRMTEATELMFGSGKRVCLGKNMAKLEIYKLFATLYSMFHVKLVDPNHEWRYFNAGFMCQTNIPVVISRRTRS